MSNKENVNHEMDIDKDQKQEQILNYKNVINKGLENVTNNQKVVKIEPIEKDDDADLPKMDPKLNFQFDQNQL